MSEMNILTLNCWGIFWTENYKERMKAIVSKLSTSNYDIVVLQEVFHKEDIDKIKLCLSNCFASIQFYYTGFIGSGVCILSKFKIIETCLIPYCQNGFIWQTCFDWFSCKSICYALIDHPLRKIHIFGTHTHATYDQEGYEYYSLRALQFFYLSKIINTFVKHNEALIVAGDLNTIFNEPHMKYLCEKCNLKDSCIIANEERHTKMYTCGAPDNTYRDMKSKPKRIDYILSNNEFDVVSNEIVFKQIEDKSISYSDHYGVFSRLKLKNSKESEPDYNSCSHDVENLKIMAKLFTKEYTISDFSGLHTFKFIQVLLLFFIAQLFILHLSSYHLYMLFSCFAVTGVFLTALIVAVLIYYVSLRCQRRIYKFALDEIYKEIQLS